MKGKIMVLGCGPAGLLAAHAATLQGWEVTIVSHKLPSFIAGAQYLHSQIEGIVGEPDGKISIIKVGDEETYAKKIYGEARTDTSWGRYPSGVVDVWNLRAAYERLWVLYEDRISDGLAMPHMIPGMLSDFRAVFSTIPLIVLFPTLKVEKERIWIMPAHDFAYYNTIIWNGTWAHPWYRASNIFGNESMEFPITFTSDREDAEIYPWAEAVTVTKPLSPGPDFFNPFEDLYLFGRYGQWKKGVLVDDAFREAYEVAGAL